MRYEKTVELRLVRAFRDMPMPARVALVKIAEQLAVQRIGRVRRVRANTPSHSLRSHGRVLRRPQHQPGVLPD